MLVATALVILMTIPGLALFYGGLVRSKNMLSVLTQVFAIFCLISILWVIYGYSLAFTAGGSMTALSAARRECSCMAWIPILRWKLSPKAWSSPKWCSWCSS